MNKQQKNHYYNKYKEDLKKEGYWGAYALLASGLTGYYPTMKLERLRAIDDEFFRKANEELYKESMEVK